MADPDPTAPRATPAVKFLRAAYLIAANTTMLLAAVLALPWLVEYGEGLARDATVLSRMPDVVRANYAHMAPADLQDLLEANNAIRFRFEYWSGYRPRAITSRFVNVDAHGIRSNGGPPRSLATLEGAIWMLGGSTAFGVGVADAETIPARLEALLGRPVVNLAVDAYNAQQENLLAARYLKSGYRPAMLLFFEGLNEDCAPIAYMREMGSLIDRAQVGLPSLLLELSAPALRLAGRMAGRLGLHPGAGPAGPPADSSLCLRDGKQLRLSELYARTLAERAALCGAYAVACRTIVQPFPGVHGRHDDPALTPEGRAEAREDFEELQPVWRRAGALFASDALDGYAPHAFIDDLHYSAAASDRIARVIAARLR